MKDESSDPWVILGYESWMLERSIQEKERLDRSIQDKERLQVLNNALTESAVLHARVLCELFANPEGKFASDIVLSRLLPDWDWGQPKYDLLNGLLSELEEKYGQYHDAKSFRFSKPNPRERRRKGLAATLISSRCQPYHGPPID
jgi:hypothetical protein